MGQICCDCCRADAELQKIFRRARKEVLKRSKLLKEVCDRPHDQHKGHDAAVHRDVQEILYNVLGAEFSHHMDKKHWEEHAAKNASK